MRKEELKKLKRINATPNMVRLAKENELKQEIVYKNRCSEIKEKTKYDMFIRCQTKGEILMIAIFFPDCMEAEDIIPTYEIYLNVPGNEFITRINGNHEKWSSSMMVNLGRVYNDTYVTRTYYMSEKDINTRIWQNPEGRKTIQQELKTQNRGWKGILEWQRKARDKNIQEKEARQQKPWDEDMSLVPDILPGFIRWSKHNAPAENFIFYNYTKNGAAHGYCSYCEKQVDISNPRHNKDSKCPCCGKKIKYKVTSRIQTLKRKSYNTEFIQKIKGGYAIRAFKNQTWYRDTTPDKPHQTMSEYSRWIVFDNGVIRKYKWDLYKNKNMRWIPDDMTYMYQVMPYVYKKNFGALKRTVLKESAIDLWEKLPCSIEKYLCAEKGNPAIEKLARIGMFNLAADVIKERYDKDLLSQEETKLYKLLKIDKARLNRLKQMNGSVTMLKWMQFEKRTDRKWPDEMIKDYGEADIKNNDLAFLPPPIHFIKAWNYLKKQSDISKESMRQTMTTWRDYVNMAEQLKWNIASEQFLYPKDVCLAHKKAIFFRQGDSMKKEAKKLEKKWPKVNSILPDIKKFEYSDKEYAIVAPCSILDIVKEGTALRHCVHTVDFYYDRIQKNESYIFFLRKAAASDKSWYTLEVEASGNIRQKRTTGDNQNDDFKQAVPFLKKWQKYFKSKLTKEEIELGIIANEVRIKEYKKLRKDGNKIWHGRLAGKLLVDVLEKDFMMA